MIQITQNAYNIRRTSSACAGGGAEALVAIVLVGKIRMRGGGTGKKRKKTDPEQILLDTLEKRKQEVCILIRKADMMPVYTAGDLEGMTGVTEQRPERRYHGIYH